MLAAEYELLEAEAERIRAARALGRSQRIQALFDLLVTAALNDRRLREFDVACEVFGRDADFDPVLDASVRVHVHRLRRKLEEYYAKAAPDRLRLDLPRGDYRLALVRPDNAAVGRDGNDPVATGRPALPDTTGPAIDGSRTGRLVLAASGWLVAAVVAVLVLVWSPWTDAEDARLERLVQTALWRDFAREPELKMLVLESDVGAQDAGAGPAPEDPNSSEDFNSSEDSGPPEDPKLPIGAAPALRDLLPVFHHLSHQRQYVMAVPVARLRPESVKRHSFVYVGFTAGLKEHFPLLFAGSRYDVRGSAGAIFDRRRGHLHRPTRADPEERSNHVEYALLSAVRGPGDNRLVIVTGTGNAGLHEAANLATDADAMQKLTRQVGDASDFEALYEVRSTGDLGLGARLIAVSSRPPPEWGED